jgi:UDP-N-acetylglucosamine:LPS N-acetylglucosamine transferase
MQGFGYARSIVFSIFSFSVLLYAGELKNPYLPIINQYEDEQPFVKQNSETNKIIIFTCIGGHTIVSQSLANSLQSFYQVEVKNIFLDVLKPVDPVRFLTLGFYNTEDFHSLCARRRWYRFMNTSYRHIALYIDIMSYLVKLFIKKAVVKSGADCIISVIPFFNNYFLSVAKELDIPFILMPTDIDVTTFLHRLKVPITHKKFNFAIAIDTPEIHEKIAPLKLSESQIHITGVALKPGFFAEHDQASIKKRFEIPEDRPVLLLLMGSEGSATIVDFMRELSRIQGVPFHLIVVFGRNHTEYETISRSVFKTISQIAFDPEVTTTFFGFTPFIPELMAISSLLITKSGGISMSEALYMNLPTLLDATSEVLAWEQMNQRFIQKNQFGTSVYHLDELSTIVKAFLTSQGELLEEYRLNMQSFEKKNGCDGIALLLNQLIGTPTDA